MVLWKIVVMAGAIKGVSLLADELNGVEFGAAGRVTQGGVSFIIYSNEYNLYVVAVELQHWINL